MPRVIRVALISVRDLMLTFGPFVPIAIALLVAAYAILDPTPPKRVVLATGPENSAYAKWGELYAAELSRFGIQVELRHTLGSLQNRRLLRDPKEKVDVAFVQGGSNDGAQGANEKKKDTTRSTRKSRRRITNHTATTSERAPRRKVTIAFLTHM